MTDWLGPLARPRFWYDTSLLTRMAQPPVGLYYFLALSMTFFRYVRIHSILLYSTPFCSLRFYPVSLTFDSILSVSATARDLSSSVLYKPLYE